MKKTQQFLSKLKLPTQDNHALESTKKRFPDDGQYRFEIPSVEGPRVFRAVIESAKRVDGNRRPANDVGKARPAHWLGVGM